MRFARATTAGALLSLVVAMASPATGKAPVTPVWEDDAGDAAVNGTIVAPLGEAGLDIVGGAIGRAGPDLMFHVTHAAMPAFGSIPETHRFMWAFTVDEGQYRITVKRADIGKPDVVAGQTTERVGRVDTEGHFRLEGDCKAGDVGGTLQPIDCAPLAYVEGKWDTAEKSFTVFVPMKLVKAKPGSIVGPGAGDSVIICPICWVAHKAERSLQPTIVDQAFTTGTYKIPR